MAARLPASEGLDGGGRARFDSATVPVTTNTRPQGVIEQLTADVTSLAGDVAVLAESLKTLAERVATCEDAETELAQDVSGHAGRLDGLDARCDAEALVRSLSYDENCKRIAHLEAKAEPVVEAIIHCADDCECRKDETHSVWHQGVSCSEREAQWRELSAATEGIDLIEARSQADMSASLEMVKGWWGRAERRCERLQQRIAELEAEGAPRIIAEHFPPAEAQRLRRDGIDRLLGALETRVGALQWDQPGPDTDERRGFREGAGWALNVARELRP